MKRSFLVLLLCIYGYLQAQVNITQLVTYCDSVMNYGIAQEDIPGAVLGIASSDSILLLEGYGYGDYNRKISVDPHVTLFQLGSVGKILTSIGLLQQIEKSKIALDDDVNKYLTDWEVNNPFDRPVTPFHLLTHSGGFNDQFINYMAKSNSEVESLGEHLPKNMPSVYQEPGTEINYSNYSYALAGHLTEQVTENQFEDYIHSAVFDPLNMSSTSYFLPDDYLDNDKYANGYKSRETFIETQMYPRHAKPAGSVVSTGKDMIVFAQALLNRDPTLLTNESYDLFLEQQFTNHPKLTGYTLGCEFQNFGSVKAISKAGQVSGFLSVLILFPDLDLTLFISTNTQTDNHFTQFFEGLKHQFFSQQKADTVLLSFDPDEYTGKYGNERTNHETIEEFFSLFAGQFSIYESNSGNLKVFHNEGWHEYQYLGNDVFQNLSNADSYITFKRKKGKINSMYRSVNVGGVDIPASYRKLSWTERPRFLNDEYPYALAIMITYLFLPLFWLVKYFIRKKKPNFLNTTSLPFYYHAVAFLFLALFIWNIIGFFIPLINLGEQMALGIPESLTHMKYFNWLMALCSIFLVILSANLWIKRDSTLLFRIYYTVFSLITVSYILILERWHFLNVII